MLFENPGSRLGEQQLGLRLFLLSFYGQELRLSLEPTHRSSCVGGSGLRRRVDGIVAGAFAEED